MNEMKDKLIKSMDNPKLFFNTLQGVKDDEDLDKLCILLKEESGIDYFRLAIDAINSQYSVFTLSRILEKVASFSILNMQNILNLYEIIFESMRGDGASYFQYDITKNIAIHNKDYAVLLLNEMYNVNKEYTMYHISTILSTLHNNHNNSQYETIKSFLSDTSNIYKTRSAIDAIKNIELSSEEANEVFELFKKIQQLSHKDLETELIYSSNKLISKYHIFKKLLENYSMSKNAEIKYHISRILMLNSKKYIKDIWFKKCLFFL
ncbi:MAG: hypothetical protein GQ474_03555, partial [Sulfurimonas sp.]|nr:hypothetical protein [Sulfurimonas sp.]